MSRQLPPARLLGPHTDTTPLEVTLVLRHRGGRVPRAAVWPHAPAMPRAGFARQCGADPGDLESARRFAHGHGLTETGADATRRVLHLRGSPSALARAFAVGLQRYQLADGRGPFIGCDREPTLPEPALAVLGLDTRPVARPQFRRPRANPARSYTPLEVGALYDFPANTDGSGQGIALIELGGGFRTSDLEHYFSGLGLARVPSVTAVPVAGGANAPGSDADAEVLLDIEVSGALAPAATLAVYFAPNTDQGFYEAISQAVHDTARHNTVISISWGGPEENWTAGARAAMQSALEDAAALGISVTAAAGDEGSSDGLASGAHVDFPASSPAALACGGTRLSGTGSTIQSEVVWNELASGEGAGGGGVSVEFARPEWQQNVALPGTDNGRGVPDVAGNADPQTGYQVLIDGKAQVIGGTSAVAPLWAALIARCNQKLSTTLGDAHAALYGLGARAFRDIISGSNGAYEAAKGWDACTGLGSPRGAALLAALAALRKS